MARKKSVTRQTAEENVYRTAKFLEPDPTMNDHEKMVWNLIVKSMRPNYFAESDRILLIEYVKLQSISTAAYHELKDYDTLLSINDNGVMSVNKLVETINKCAGTMATISQKLGISPSSRVRHEAKVVKPESITDLDGMLD